MAQRVASGAPAFRPLPLSSAGRDVARGSDPALSGVKRPREDDDRHDGADREEDEDAPALEDR